jgi:aminopeptidase N
MGRILPTFFILLLTFQPSDLFAQYPRDWDVDVVHYRFHLTLRDGTDEIDGRAEVTVRFTEDGKDSFVLDLVGEDAETGQGMAVVAVTRDAAPIAFEHADNKLHITLDSPSRAEDRRTYAISYRGIPADGLIISTNMHGDRTFFGDNWPNRARHWLPTVDDVSDKATVEWIVTAPEHYDVVGTGRLVERSELGDGTGLTHWRSEVPIPPKVMVMGAARFAIRTTGYVGSVPIQAWVYPQNREAGFFDYAQARKAVAFFTTHVGPFPYAKLANVQSKTRYGGMENAGNIFYSERSVRGDRSNEGLIVHETAHQWFGDSVTEREWWHIWLSEGFATYFTHLYRELVYGRERLVAGMQRDRNTVLRFYAQAPELALIPLQLEDPNRMLNRNAYQKGGWVLHMLRRQVGDDAFWQGIREYYRQYRDSTALTEDLRRVMEEASGQDLEWFFQQWGYRPGHPVLAHEWSFDPASGQVTFTVRQVQDINTTFRFPLDIRLVAGEATSLETVEITGREHTFTLPFAVRPEQVTLDPETWLLFEGGIEPGFDPSR